MHLPPEVWGPIVWATMHLVSLGYAEDPSYSEKRAAKDFYNSLPHLLPCSVCREHFREVLKGLPVETWLDNRTSLIEWVWMVHNKVNERLGKAQITQAEFYQRYREMADRGLPVPPASPTAEIADAKLTEQYAQGAAHAAIGIAAVTLVGGLLWMSYKSKH